MEETLFPGNRVWLIFGVCLLVSVFVVGFSAYKSKRLAEISLADKELCVYESKLSKLNQLEIEGSSIQ